MFLLCQFNSAPILFFVVSMLVTTRFCCEKAVEQSNSKEKVYISFHGI
jgi:hypothetical protein